jgi:hypothetical protein
MPSASPFGTAIFALWRMVKPCVSVIFAAFPTHVESRFEASINRRISMRDLTTTELGFVYGAGSCGKPCSPPPSCHGGSKGKGTGSKGHGSKSCGSKSKGSKSKSKGSKGRCGC